MFGFRNILFLLRSPGKQISFHPLMDYFPFAAHFIMFYSLFIDSFLTDVDSYEIQSTPGILAPE